MREVQSPDGRVWRVRRRWMPKHPRLFRGKKRDVAGDAADSAWWMPGDWSFDFDDLGAAVSAVLAAAVIGVILFTVVFPLLALTVELMLIVVLFVGGTIGRIVFGRPWRIEAQTIGAPRLTREMHAKGFRGSREAIDTLASEIAAGR